MKAKTQNNNIIVFPIARRPVDDGAAKPRRVYKRKGPAQEKDYAPEAGWKPLSTKQKARLASLAKEAAAKQYLPVAGKEHDAWRQDQAVLACGVRISQASQKHWSDLLVHFTLMCGRDAQAFHVALRAQDNGHRVAMWKLREELAKRALPECYAETICQSKFSKALADVTAPQVWTLVYDLRGRKK